MILRLNPDGTAPRDNPFYRLGAERGGQVGANLKKIYAYGLRNGFGMAFDPFSGDLWEQENGDDSFSEINRAEPGFNSGWVQVMGPLERVAQFKAIETTRDPEPARSRTPRTATTASSRSAGTRSTSPTRPREAYDRLFKLPGSRVLRPGAGVEVRGRPGRHRLPLHARSSARTTRATCSSAPPAARCAAATSSALPIEDNRKKVDVSDDRRLQDRVADNLAKYEITESESLLFGENFGVTPDIKESPDGTLTSCPPRRARSTRSAASRRGRAAGASVAGRA